MSILMTKWILYCALCVIISLPPWHQLEASLPVWIWSFWQRSCPWWNCSGCWPVETNPAWGRVMPNGQGKQMATTADGQHPALVHQTLLA